MNQLKTQYPSLPDNTTIYFDFPEGFKPERLLKNSGAVIRVTYDNPTLRGRAVTIGDIESIGRLGNRQNLFFKWTDSGDLLDLSRENGRPPP